MAKSDSIDVDLFAPIWTAGWQWPWVAVLGLMLGGNFLLGPGRVWIGVLALVGGPALSAGGIRYVNAHSEAALETGARQARAVAAELVALDDEEVAVYSLRHGRGSPPFVHLAKKYDLVTLTLGETHLVVHDAIELNLLALKYKVDPTATEFDYDQITSVDYADGEFRIDLADGTRESYRSATKPDDALAAVRRRIHSEERIGTED